MEFGFLTVKAYTGRFTIRKSPIVECVCRCGRVVLVSIAKLKNGVQVSCGCIRKTREYTSWKEAKSRISDEGHVSFFRYGGRGITMSAEWQRSFLLFLKDMGPCPDGFTLDRINNDGNYEKGNCRWATRKEQGQNTSKTKLTKQLVEVIKELYLAGVKQKVIAEQMNVSQPTISKALSGKQW